MGAVAAADLRRAAPRGGSDTGDVGAFSSSRSEAKEENLSPEEQQKRMRREIERTIAGDPAALARLLESWLMEQKA